MATYRLSVMVAKRSGGRSATSMAAYRACEAVTDERTGMKFDFSRKSGLLSSQIIAPEDAPEWARDRSELWNRSEFSHKTSKAVVAREIQLSLPHELNNAERRELASEFAQYMADRYKIAVDTCLHAPNKEGDERNFHAHLMLCTRSFDATQETGLSKTTVRELDPIACSRKGNENHVTQWRETWAEMLNNALERANVRDSDGVRVEVDHRSYKDREIDLEPQLKEGPAATAKKRRGEETDRAEMNEAIKQRNEERQRMAAEIDAPELLRRQAEQFTAQQWQELKTSAANDNSPALPAPRSAHSMTASQLQQELTAANDNQAATLTPRHAQGMTASQVQQELTASNDNAPVRPREIKRADWETDQQYAKRVAGILEREQKKKDAPELEIKPSAPTISY